MTGTRTVVPCLLLVACLAAAGPALAAPSAADRETARTLLVEGDRLTELREHARALPSYRAAHAIMVLPSTGLAVAKTLVALRRLVEARDVVMSVVRIPVEPGEPDPVAHARVEASRLAAELEQRIPTVRVVTGQGTAPVRVELDGRELPPAAATQPYKLDPGEHVARVRWPDGREAVQSFTLEEGRPREVIFATPAPGLPRAESPSHAQGIAGAPPAARSNGWTPLAYVGFGTAAAAVATGAVTGILAWSRTSKLAGDCPGLTCTCADEACRSARQDDIDQISTLATISNVAFGIGVIAAGVGTIGLLSGDGESRRGDSAVRVNAFAGWGRVGVEGGF